MKGMSKVAPALATGALSALGSLGIDKIFGKGLQVDGQRSRRSLPVYVPPSISEAGLINPYAMPPPFIGTWKNPIGLGVKKKAPKRRKSKKGEGLLLCKDSPFNGIPLLGAIL